MLGIFEVRSPLLDDLFKLPIETGDAKRFTLLTEGLLGDSPEFKNGWPSSTSLRSVSKPLDLKGILPLSNSICSWLPEGILILALP